MTDQNHRDATFVRANPPYPKSAGRTLVRPYGTYTYTVGTDSVRFVAADGRAWSEDIAKVMATDFWYEATRRERPGLTPAEVAHYLDCREPVAGLTVNDYIDVHLNVVTQHNDDGSVTVRSGSLAVTAHPDAHGLNAYWEARKQFIEKVKTLVEQATLTELGPIAAVIRDLRPGPTRDRLVTLMTKAPVPPQ